MINQRSGQIATRAELLAVRWSCRDLLTVGAGLPLALPPGQLASWEAALPRGAQLARVGVERLPTGDRPNPGAVCCAGRQP